MPLTAEQRKEKLGRKAGKEIAAETGRSPSQVSRVINGKRRDPEVEPVIARRLRTSVRNAFPEFFNGSPLLGA